MPTDISLLISITALLSSLSFAFSIFIFFRSETLQRTQLRTELLTQILRTELLTQIVHFRLEFTRFIHRIDRLKDNPPVPQDVEGLLSAGQGFGKFEQQTEGYRQVLLKGNLNATSLQKLRHFIEALVKQLADDNSRLDSIIETISKPENV
jgi:hypothetical protein